MSAEPRNPYAELMAIGAQIDHHESDLYVEATPETIKLVKSSKWFYTTFRNQIDHKLWLEIPFAYLPFWDQKKR
jgi:hypothetical protein